MKINRKDSILEEMIELFLDKDPVATDGTEIEKELKCNFYETLLNNCIDKYTNQNHTDRILDTLERDQPCLYDYLLGQIKKIKNLETIETAKAKYINNFMNGDWVVSDDKSYDVIVKEIDKFLVGLVEL